MLSARTVAEPVLAEVQNMIYKTGVNRRHVYKTGGNVSSSSSSSSNYPSK
jgi:hypothetical protein